MVLLLVHSIFNISKSCHAYLKNCYIDFMKRHYDSSRLVALKQKEFFKYVKIGDWVPQSVHKTFSSIFDKNKVITRSQ